VKINLLVTLANENYLEYAKQLFSSVYWNAGWSGDYMLLAHEVPEKKLKWFRNKGILVKKVKPISTKGIRFMSHPPVVFSKFYLFTPYFKKWKNIVFLDLDIIVRASLDELTEVRGFAAPKETGLRFKQLFNDKDKKSYDKLKKNYELRGYGFNTGILAFNPQIIQKGDFKKLMEITRDYGKIITLVDESIINLFFYRQWKKLPPVYNLHPCKIFRYNLIKPKEVKTRILHFVKFKRPWEKDSFFYKEWESNRKRAELINLKKIPKINKLKEGEIEDNLDHIKSRLRIINLLDSIDQLLGEIGEYLKKDHLTLYCDLKKIEKNTKKIMNLKMLRKSPYA
jgi:lipopolysaccharide biosynthesis glycosyltransferase